MRYKVCRGSEVVSVLPTNRSFAESFDGENPIYPIGGKMLINRKEYKIVDFQKSQNIANVKVVEAA